MSGLMYGVGAIAVVVGVVMIGFGIPVNEFSFGNTLISAGTTAAAGGLVIIGLGVVVAQLQRINETLATRVPIKSGRPFDTFDHAAGLRNAPAPSRIPFPPRPKADAGIREPHPLEPDMKTTVPTDTAGDELPAAPSFSPTLRNPEEAPVTVEDDVSLSPPHPMAAPTRGPGGFGESFAVPPPSRVADTTGPDEDRYEPKPDTGRRSPPPPIAPAPARPPQSTYFDTMWPAKSKPAKDPAGTETKSGADTGPHGPKLDLPPRETAGVPAQASESDASRPANEPRSVAILKSGVVDGMGYTLYVDGSIEAELPQGTLRFGSINELRSHLEKNS
jgi:hypothetical protein